ncbi:MAG: formimidoylglutamase [Flavobacteriales bacterium]|nr:formimidoylglutamase [Flavobacteriales bacterium]MEB2342595.1 formimidoylglutamase [Flavobacteriia bacterium]
MPDTLHFTFRTIPPAALDSLVAKRKDETKLGEVLAADWRDPDCRYVLLGIREDIGPRANNGYAGARHAFDAFLPNFLNLQANRFIRPGSLHVLGTIDPILSVEHLDQAVLRKQVEELDEFVLRTVLPVLEAGKVPIVIGGGHNNAYPLIKAAAAVQGAPVDVINLDPHADCRPLEGRHSGNSFSYAITEGHLRRYAVFGLHRARNSEAILRFMDDHGVHHTFFAEYMMQPGLFQHDIDSFLAKEATPLCVELDMDVIRHMPSSAFSPSGMVLEDARTYLRKVMASPRHVHYVHLPEAAPNTPSQGRIVGKALAFLVHDVISVRGSGMPTPQP